MKQPFHSLGFNVLPASASKRLSAYVRNRPELIKPHISSVVNEYDGLSHFDQLGLFVIQNEIASLRKNLLVPFQPSIMLILPRTHLDKHVDGLVGGRRTAIISQLHPLTEYAPTQFWSDYESGSPTFELSDHQLPAIIDLQAIHSVNNSTNHLRFNFQLTIDMNFSEVLELHQEGKLFRSVQSST